MSLISLLDIDDLIIMRTLLCRSGSVAECCRKLCVTQPAVHGRIRKIRLVFGNEPITTKIGRNTQLTRHGEDVAVLCEKVLTILESACAVYNDGIGKNTGYSK